MYICIYTQLFLAYYLPTPPPQNGHTLQTCAWSLNYLARMWARLQVETKYRMSEEKYDELAEASQFALQHLQVAEAVEKLTQQHVAQVVAEYPAKKNEVNSEKALVLELIQMVKRLDFGAAEKSAAAQQQLQYINSQIADITGEGFATP